MTRVFVGIPLSDDLKDLVKAWQDEHPNLPVRWTSRDNLHITLVPPWREKNIEAVVAKLNILKNKFGDIGLEFKNVSFGSNPRSPRLIWASGATPQKLQNLTKEIYFVLGFPAPDKELFTHTTLARFRPEEFPTFPVKKLDENIDWRMRVKKVIIYESRLRAVGADYIPLGEVEI